MTDRTEHEKETKDRQAGEFCRAYVNAATELMRALDELEKHRENMRDVVRRANDTLIDEMRNIDGVVQMPRIPRLDGDIIIHAIKRVEKARSDLHAAAEAMTLAGLGMLAVKEGLLRSHWERERQG